MPGASEWRLLEPFATRWWSATLPGELYDTARGYPALRLGGEPGVPGWVMELKDPAPAALSTMDSYEGTEYQRVLVTLPDGVRCWTYVWIAGFDGMRRLKVWSSPDPRG